MPKWRVAQSCPAEHHLPPIDLTTTLTLSKKNKPRALYKIDTPTNEYGLPDAEQLLHAVASTVHKTYEWPEMTNIHHLAYPRALYHSTSELSDYREHAGRMLHIPIQFHNYIHEFSLPAPIPSMDVVRRCLIEQRRIDVLFENGRRAVRFAKWADEFESEKPYESNYFRMRAGYAEDNYYRVLDRCEESQIGLGYDLGRIQTMSISEATAELGRLAASSALDFRHESQRLVQRYGFQ